MGPVTYADNEEHMFRRDARTTNVADDTPEMMPVHGPRRGAQPGPGHHQPAQGKDRVLAKALMKYETITGEEVSMILRGEDFETAKDRQLGEDNKDL